MGAYLSKPITVKETSAEENDFMLVASSSMQGWRMSQEDAHNAILNYDDQSSLFAVYDGHGGEEVAKYCSLKLPNFIKESEAYKNKNISEALKSSFIAFDATLVEPKVIAELKKLAGSNDEDEESDPDEAFDLQEEAGMPIEDVVAMYSRETNGERTKEEPKEDSASGSELKNARLSQLSQSSGRKFNSPFLRAKRDAAEGLVQSKNLDSELNEATNENDHTEIHTDTKDSTTEASCVGETKSDIEKKVKDEDHESENKKPENGGSGNGNCENGYNEVDDKPVTINGDKDVCVSVKGKGKGKGKSSMAKSIPSAEGTKIDEVPSPKKKQSEPKSGQELYQKILEADSEGEDEDLDDENDENFGEEVADDSDDAESEEDEAEEEDDDEEDDDSEDDEEDEDEDELNGEGLGGNFNEEPGNDSGCTAVVALLRGRELFVANAGDSRCIVCRDGKAVDMSEDHKPEDPLEMDRIKKAGGQVTADGRVNGGLNLSRAIGDHAYKGNKSLSLIEQMISPEPDIRHLQLDPARDSFVFLACDGIWNSMSSQEVVDFINERLDGESMPTQDKLKKICEEMFDHCLAPDTMGDGTGCDNMTAVLVKLKGNFGKDNSQPTTKREASPDPENSQSKKQKLEEDSATSSS